MALENRHEARDVKSTKGVSDAKVQPANSKEALCVLDGQASANSSAIQRAVKFHDYVKANW